MGQGVEWDRQTKARWGAPESGAQERGNGAEQLLGGVAVLALLDRPPGLPCPHNASSSTSQQVAGASSAPRVPAATGGGDPPPFPQRRPPTLDLSNRRWEKKKGDRIFVCDGCERHIHPIKRLLTGRYVDESWKHTVAVEDTKQLEEDSSCHRVRIASGPSTPPLLSQNGPSSATCL